MLIRTPAVAAIALSLSVLTIAQAPRALDKDAEKWVQSTLGKMSVEEKVGQMIVPSFQSTFMSTDSDEFDALVKLIHEQNAGGFHVFGGAEKVPGVLLNPTYGAVTLGQPLEAASILNRLQAVSKVPLLNTADFEAGVGFRIAGATSFPRLMAFGAARDEGLAEEAGRITGEEARALGVHVNFAPVVDVNNNPRNPVINTRSYGEDPAMVGRLASAYIRGMQGAGVAATLKHFPGHGDTDVDSHLGLPIIKHPRARLDQIELVPFRAGVAAGADAVMTAHIELPELDPAPKTPTTLSAPIIQGLLRKDLGFDGLIYTDSMGMAGVAAIYTPGEAAVRAVKAGNDVILHSPDDAAAFDAVVAAVKAGEIPAAQLNASVQRILRAKAKAGLHRNKLVNLEQVSAIVGTRKNLAVADAVSERSITLLKDTRNQVPLRAPREAQVLYLSVLDFPSNWRIAAPSRTFIPELRKRWPNVTAIELSDRTTPAEIDLVRAMAPRFDVVIASVFVRAGSASGRMDLAEPLQRLLNGFNRGDRPFVTVFFGNPYVAMYMPDLPSVMLTYDFYDRAEASAVKALAGEIPIGGRLPIELPGYAKVGAGLDRAAGAAAPWKMEKGKR
ncbi:MAG: glycoside hydrolase family 3 protein [Acidobacteriota bacterium]|nr:glycoside hydrolase family 3 protein [Acidobacteriota bacterium]